MRKHTYPGEPDPHVRIHNGVFEDLFMRWPGCLNSAKILAYVARYSWGYGVSDDNEGRKWTRNPFSASLCAAEISGVRHVSRQTVSTRFHKLLSIGVLKRRADGRVSIDKYRLAECVRDRVRPDTIRPKASPNSDVRVSGRRLTLTKASPNSDTKRHLTLTAPSSNSDGPPLEPKSPDEVTGTEIQKNNTERQKTKYGRANARPDLVWDYFAEQYKAYYGEDPTPKAECFVNLARIRKAHTDEVIKQRIERLFLWRPDWLKGRWTFMSFVKHFDEIPANGEQNANRDTPLERMRRRALADRERAGQT